MAVNEHNSVRRESQENGAGYWILLLCMGRAKEMDFYEERARTRTGGSWERAKATPFPWAAERPGKRTDPTAFGQ